tara:strand:+ start:314 stop:901 length:588 start_codon:yes stop_codon:yes gene_type:complete
MKLLFENWRRYLSEAEREKVDPMVAKLLDLDYEYVDEMPDRIKHYYYVNKKKYTASDTDVQARKDKLAGAENERDQQHQADMQQIAREREDYQKQFDEKMRQLAALDKQQAQNFKSQMNDIMAQTKQTLQQQLQQNKIAPQDAQQKYQSREEDVAKKIEQYAQKAIEKVKGAAAGEDDNCQPGEKFNGDTGEPCP